MKICIALSGGVDSSVAALLLKRAGYDVFALFMQNWHDTTGTLHGDCEWEEDRFVAEMVARKIGIPFYFVDLSDEYRKRVVDYMFSEYEAGRTPNPDVLCNREIKFDAFLKTAEKLGADMVATGHYCRKDSFRDSGGREIFRILEGRDPGKDQSYFLCQLSQEQLSKALFPIGDMLKSEVRALAREADLPSAEKKDSQGICFVGMEFITVASIPMASPWERCILSAPSFTPRQKLPPPITRPICTPRSRHCRMTSHTELITVKSRPRCASPARASPLTFSKMRLYLT